MRNHTYEIFFELGMAFPLSNWQDHLISTLIIPQLAPGPVAGTVIRLHAAHFYNTTEINMCTKALEQYPARYDLNHMRIDPVLEHPEYNLDLLNKVLLVPSAQLYIFNELLHLLQKNSRAYTHNKQILKRYSSEQMYHCFYAKTLMMDGRFFANFKERAENLNNLLLFLSSTDMTHVLWYYLQQNKLYNSSIEPIVTKYLSDVSSNSIWLSLDATAYVTPYFTGRQINFHSWLMLHPVDYDIVFNSLLSHFHSILKTKKSCLPSSQMMALLLIFDMYTQKQTLHVFLTYK